MAGPYEDLLKDSSESFEDGNYFIVTINDLDPNATYPLQFRWKYKDGTFAKDWSAVKVYVTPGESNPNTPSFLASDVDVSEPEKLIITYRGLSDDATPVPITDIDRVDVYISGAPFDGTKPAYSFKEAGTQIIPAPAGTYIIVLYAISKLGTKSPVSSPVTKTVTAAIVPVDPPTLPSGLSVASAPFAVSVNWNGSYSSGGFDGFKSIDIHVRGSDVGATATSGFSTTTQVATLTVDSTTNRQNVGLDNLRQALSLANNTAAYTAPMFFYYIARNQNDELYSVGGTPTYTRINSTTVNPTQANFVDLANGVISIENLVAGNGQFSSWLRTGSAGGTRIELSSVNDFSNGGYTVQKGLVAYSSGNTEIFNLDLDAGSLTINGSGTFTGNLTAGTGNSIFKSDSSGIYLGNATYALAPFSVSRNGIIKAESGTIGGWTLGTTFLQGNNIKLDNSQIIVGSTSVPYLDIQPTSITHRNAGGAASGLFTLTLGSSSSLSLSGTITLNASSTIDGTSASTIKSGAASGATALQEGNGVSKNGSNQINTILMNSGGISISTASSGTRMQLNNSGLQLFNGSTRTVFLDGSTGNAEFTGTITGGVLRTGTSGSRIIISGSDQSTNPNAITFTNSSGSPISHLVPLNIGGSSFGLLMHYGSTADQSGGTYPQMFIGSGNVSMSARAFAGGPGGLAAVSNSGVVLQASGGSDITFSGGNVVFGTTTGQIMEYLSSNGNLRIGSNTTRLEADGEIFANTLGTGSGLAIHQVQSGGNAGYLKVNTSTIRHKENINYINESGYLNKVINLNPVFFTYKEEYGDPGRIELGLIAEDLEQLGGFETVLHYNNDGDLMGISYDKLSAMLILALKEVKQRLDALEG